MKGYTVLLLLLCSFYYSGAQLNEDFTDGNFTTNPAWSGDTSKFKISSSSSIPSAMRPGLQLNGTGADTSSLFTFNTMTSLDNMEWSFWVHLSFNTSHSNNLRVYIACDNTGSTEEINGYYILFGDDTEDQSDNISLWKQTGVSEEKIIEGTVANTGKSGSYRIRVTRNGAGKWSLYSDTLGNRSFRKEGEATDDTYNSSGYFGFYCKYTSTNKTSFYFDDIYDGPVIIDTIPPKPMNTDVLSSNKTDILFSEAVESNSAGDNNNYLLAYPGVSPSVVSQDLNNPALIHLTFPVNFQSGGSNTIYFYNLGDYSENVNVRDSISFFYYKALPNEVIISEIMPEPSPSVGLPDAEYIELLNRKPFPLSISGWKLRLGSSCRILSSAVIPADGYILLCSDSSATKLSQYGQTLAVSGFSLVNTGESITLQDRQGSVINTLTYSDKWYQDNARDEGGWSLEIIDPENPCAGMENWRASVSPGGGSPGQINSVNASNPDIESPFVLRAGVCDTMNAMIYFSERMDSVSIAHITSYRVDNGIGQALAVDPQFPDFRCIRIALPVSLLKGLAYHLTISGTLTDCSGNIIEHNETVMLALPDTVKPDDIVINEILSNPKDDGVDFVEIFNRSNKVFDLKTMRLANEEEDVISDVIPFCFQNMLFFPGEYLVLSTNMASVKKQYFTSDPRAFLDMPDFSSFNDDEGTVVITDEGLREIDQLHYSGDMHFPLLKTTDGVSLERIDANRITQDRLNWHSASESAGFATPGYKNSQSLAYIVTDEPVKLSPEIFSPDNDGYNDLLKISYLFGEPGFVANVTIFDDKGRLVRELINNELLGTEGYFIWDGINQSGEKASIGFYIVYFEVFNQNGKVKKVKKTAVLGGKL